MLNKMESHVSLHNKRILQRALVSYKVENQLTEKIYDEVSLVIEKLSADPKRYYYQIPVAGKRWDETPPIIMEFSDRAAAVQAGYLLSLSHRVEIRFADNPYYHNNGGSYILHDAVKVGKEVHNG